MDLLRGPHAPQAKAGHMAVARKLHGVLSLVNQMARSLFLPRKLSIMKLVTETHPQVHLLHGHDEPAAGPAHDEWLPALRDAGMVVLVGEMVLPLYSMATVSRLGMEGARLAMAWTRLTRPAEPEVLDPETEIIPSDELDMEPEPQQDEPEHKGLWDVAWITDLRSTGEGQKTRRSQAA